MARDPLTWSSLLTMGATSALLLVAGFGLGWWIDGLAHTSPAFVLVGMALGLGAAGAYTYVEIRKFLSD
jgi:F0F1-type ATP synthase assembly protein I